MQRRYYRPDIETMSRADFQQWQWHELEKQIRYTYAKSPLCRRKFAEAKITPDDIRTPEDFRHRVPFTTKQDMMTDQQERPPYGTRLAVTDDEIAFVMLTSGTSGRGQEVHAMSRRDRDRYTDAFAMFWHWSGFKKGDRFMNPLPVGLPGGGTTLTWAMDRLGVVTYQLGTYDTRTKLECIRRFRINRLMASGPYLEALAAEAEKLGLDPGRDLCVETIRLGGPYPVSFVQRMEEKWHARVVEYYGSTQYALAGTCEKGSVWNGQRAYMHLLGHIAYQEVINPETGEPVGPGEEGEMIVTPLDREASPFLRFKQSDKVRYFPSMMCECGRPFDLIEAGTVSRYDDMMKIKGMNIWPKTIDEIVLTKEECAEYKGRLYITEERKEKVEVSVEFKPGVLPELRQHLLSKIADELRERTGIGFTVNEAREKLPRFVSKATSLRWADERTKGLEKQG